MLGTVLNNKISKNFSNMRKDENGLSLNE